MTKTLTSPDSGKHYFLTINVATGKAEACTCPDRYYRSTRPACKHMAGFNEQLRKAETFLALKNALDIRSSAQQAARRERYCELFGIYTY